MERKQEILNQIADCENQINSGINLHAEDMLKQQIAALRGEYEQIESQQQIEQNHEQRVQEAKDEFGAYIQASLDEDGITLEEIFVGDKQRQLYTIKSSQAFNALASKLSAQLSGAEERELQLQRQNGELQDKYEALEAELRQVKSKAAQLEFERDEANKTRDNAANALEEARQEVDRLNDQVSDLRKEIAVGARNSYKVVDPEEQRKQLEDLVKQVKESRIKVINMRPVADDFRRQTWQAEDAITGETYTFNYLEKGKYKELNETEVQQFRLEQAQKATANAVIPLVPPALPDVTPDQFRGSMGESESTQTVRSDDAGVQGVPGDTETVSLSARIEALEADVAALKRANGMVA